MTTCAGNADWSTFRITQQDPTHMDSDTFIKLFEQMNHKIDTLSQSSEIIKNEIGSIKTRLFNGITDTTRETYSRVIGLEAKQNYQQDVLDEIQKNWSEKFSVHDTKERLYHTLVATVMAFLVTVFVALVVFELEKYHILKLMANEVTPESSSRLKDSDLPPGPVLPNP
jgi:hypothetical protein